MPTFADVFDRAVADVYVCIVESIVAEVCVCVVESIVTEVFDCAVADTCFVSSNPLSRTCLIAWKYEFASSNPSSKVFELLVVSNYGDGGRSGLLW